MTSKIVRRCTAWTALMALGAALSLSTAPRCGEPMPPLTTTFTPYLPFDMAAEGSPRKVFAHYMPSLPISIDNKDGNEDYYATQYLTVTGENGVHAAYGGLLRDRPLPRPPIAAPDWRAQDLKTEISQAKSVGIDGFAVDVIEPRAASDVIDRILQAASESGDFTILITADVSGVLGAMTPADFAAEMARYLSSASAFRVANGRPVLGAFAAELKSPEWWSSVVAILTDTFHIPVAFVPTFLDPTNQLDRFASVSFGFSMWGGRNPLAMTLRDIGRGSPVDVIRRTHRLGKVWMQPVVFQDNRPRNGIFEESGNGLTNRLSWQLADQNGAQWVQLITWNDYVEMTAMAPSVVHGWRILDMNAYDIFVFKYGRAPVIARDALFVSYRIQPADAVPLYPETSLMRLVPHGVPASNNIEVVSFATAPSHVTVRAGVQDYSCDVPAGRGICTFPLSLGSISAEMVRNGATVATARSNADVTATPLVQDLQYRVVGGLR